ncbi:MULTISPECIES: hypothetical protein [Pedobacter]|uniref:hypothetical protein n=1 Tax=Pedobacter TaxID=84567 RepID=UPI001E3A2346|nr:MULTISPECIES: hypothetical protein [Pedobacter]
MNENIENNDWKRDAPVLAAMVRSNPFTVPNHYFESVEESVISNVFLDGLKQNTNCAHFEVPQHYFEELTERIEANIRIVELPKAENSFAVPQNYFDNLQSRINDRIAATFEDKVEVKPELKIAKIVPLWRKSLVKYASAACFVLIASFGAYFYQNSTSIPVAQTQPSDLANEQMLYDIDESTIIDHLEAQTNMGSKTTSASDTEMENYILSNFSSSDLTHELNN